MYIYSCVLRTHVWQCIVLLDVCSVLKYSLSLCRVTERSGKTGMDIFNERCMFVIYFIFIYVFVSTCFFVVVVNFAKLLSIEVCMFATTRYDRSCYIAYKSSCEAVTRMAWSIAYLNKKTRMLRVVLRCTFRMVNALPSITTS